MLSDVTDEPHGRLRGVLIAESLRPDVKLVDLGIAVDAIARVRADSPAPGQPGVWTLINFEIADAAAEELAAKFSAGLRSGPWYVEFRGKDTFVVFADKVFRYARGDTAGRSGAAAHGRAVGVPEEQLDW